MTIIFSLALTSALHGIRPTAATKPQQPAGQADQKPTPPILPPIAQTPTVKPLIPVPLPGQSQIYQTAPLTADDAARIAVRLQPSLAVALAQEVAAKGLLVQARSGLYPSLSYSGSYNYTTRLGQLGEAGSTNSTGGTTGGTGSTTGSVGGNSGFQNVVTARQLVYDFNKTLDGVRQAKENVLAATFAVKRTQQSIVYAVKQQYYSAKEAQKLVSADQAIEANASAELDLALATLKQGLGAPSDVVTATANLATARSALAQAEQTQLLSTVGLAALIGVDPRTPLNLGDTGEAVEPNLDNPNNLVNTALTQRPDLLGAEATLRAAEAGLSVAKKGLAPSLSLSLTVSDRGSNNPFTTDTTGAGLALSWPLGDGGATQGRIEQSNGLLAQAQANLKQSRLTVVSDVVSAIGSIQSAEQRVGIAQAGLQNAQLGLQLAEGRYKSGVAQFIEITQAQATLASAETALLDAQASLESARAQLDLAIGKDALVGSRP